MIKKNPIVTCLETGKNMATKHQLLNTLITTHHLSLKWGQSSPNRGKKGNSKMFKKKSTDFIQCTRPPKGWACYLRDGHTGSCPAYENSPVKPISQKITCPKCSHSFAWGDLQISEQQKAIIVLTEHGFSIRAVGRMMSLAPESVSYRIKEAKRHKFVAQSKKENKK